VPEVLRDGVEGYLVEARDVETMAQRALEILSSPKRQLEMSRAARQRAQQNFCSSSIIPQYEDLYRRVLENG
jgi:glycosyltransferase involved in cell wall biosynthesis